MKSTIMKKNGHIRRNRCAGTVLVLCFLCAVFLMLLFPSCATEKVEIVEHVEHTGIKGTVKPVDSSGNEIILQDKGNIIINCIPVQNGVQIQDRSMTANAKDDGSFVIELKGGEYFVEVFLEGFYVNSFSINLEKNLRKNLGEITIQRIETASGIPLKDDEFEEAITGEGDVAIQPPA